MEIPPFQIETRPNRCEIEMEIEMADSNLKWVELNFDPIQFEMERFQFKMPWISDLSGAIYCPDIYTYHVQVLAGRLSIFFFHLHSPDEATSLTSLSGSAIAFT